MAHERAFDENEGMQELEQVDPLPDSSRHQGRQHLADGQRLHQVGRLRLGVHFESGQQFRRNAILVSSAFLALAYLSQLPLSQLINIGTTLQWISGLLEIG